ncbi:MAG: hypothetical protein JSW39_14030 [Desulfobacterales bacterium]|nr:MAG: hypothetical protein JSW39_14030 [Desulfobacterales bacterium]
MKKWLYEHPYLSTSIVFLAIIIFGWHFLYWKEDNFAFLLLLYFIVTLGIRLDDISKKIGISSGNPSRPAGEKDNILSQLKDIKSSLLQLNITLEKILDEREEESATASPPERNP